MVIVAQGTKKQKLQIKNSFLKEFCFFRKHTKF